MKLRNLDNSSSRVKKNHPDLVVDWISALPYAILGLILSNLPTKNAVATSILSKRWKFVWTTVHNLDFCLKDRRNELPEDAIMKFAQFVNRVLLLLDGEFLNKVSLAWGPRFVPSQVSSWITTIITRNVRDLFVSVRFPYEYKSIKPLQMPASVFNAYSLQCLELCACIVVPAEIVVCLPSLESLKLVSVYFQSETSFENFICGCPKLNYLSIDMDNWDDFTFIISSTSLRRLEVCVDDGCSNVLSNRNLQLEASSLEYLKIVGPISRVFVKGCLSSLVEADFGIYTCGDESAEDYYDLHIEAVRAFDSANTVILSVDAMWETACACECDYDRLDWTDPVEVPRCLSNSLNEVSFKGYHGFDDEREMIGYMLMHGSVLEVMKVTCKPYEKGYSLERMELLKQISRFPRKSPACILEFIE